MADTYESDINYKFSLANGENITLDKYESNAISQNIYASVENKNLKERYDILLRGQDDLGNKVEFYVSRGREAYIDFQYDNYDRNIADNAKTIILTPYAVKIPEKSGKMPDRDEYVKVGEEFSINLNK